MQNNSYTSVSIDQDFFMEYPKKNKKDENILYFEMPIDDYNFLYTCEKYFHLWNYEKDTITVKLPFKDYKKIISSNKLKLSGTIKKKKKIIQEIKLLQSKKYLTKREENRKISLESRVKTFKWNIECLKRGEIYHSIIGEENEQNSEIKKRTANFWKEGV